MAAPHEITGHLQVRVNEHGRRYYASSWERRQSADDGQGSAHVQDSGRRTARGAVIWRTASGPCPPGHLTPKVEARLEELLADVRAAARIEPVQVVSAIDDDIPTFGDAIDAWLDYIETEKRRKTSTCATRAASRRPGGEPRFDRHEIVVRGV